MKKSLLLLLLLLGFVLQPIRADEPFRIHRYSAFTTLEVDSMSIVFVGNSITNMHEWWEAFGCNPNILNRGVSGSYSNEVIANLENVISGKPAKIFFMIGTNDIGDFGNGPVAIAANVRKIVERVQKESPATEIYLQSILPSTIGKRNLPDEQQANDSLRAICQDMGLTYVDLWDLFTDIPSADASGVSNDGLHLSAKGFYLWCNRIAPYVGSECVYTNSANQYGGIRQSYGMRVTAFGDLPVYKDDVLFIGDELIHGGEWHELLHSAKAKDRGNDWDYPGRPMSITLASIPIILQGRPGNEAPAKVFLYAGVRDVNASTDLSATAQEYQKMVDKIRTLVPTTKVYLMAHLPQTTASTNTQKVAPFNALLKQMAEGMEGVTYVDSYTPFLKNGVANTQYMTGNYLTGRGYNRIAHVVAEYLEEEGVSVLSEEQADSLATLRESRNALGAALFSISRYDIGEGVGQYSATALSSLTAKIEAAYQMLKEGADNATLQAAATELTAQSDQIMSAINQPQASTATDETWYTFCSTLRDSRYIAATAASGGVTGAATGTANTAMWKFVARSDNKGWDIVNREYGCFLSPSASYNTQIQTTASQPSTGWMLSYASTPGMYIVSSGTVELNQTKSEMGYKLYNWSSGQNGTDRTDLGCQFTLAEADISVPDNPVVLPDPAYETSETLTFDGTQVYRIPDSEADKIKGDQLTIYVDLTETSVTTDRHALVASSDEDGTEFFSLFGQQKYGVRYTSNTTGAADQFTLGGAASTNRTQLVLLIDNSTRHYILYQDGTMVRDFSHSALAEGGQWEYRTLGNVKGQSGMFLGGVKLGSGNNLLFRGTIHDVRIWDSVLTAEQIATIKVRDHATTGLGRLNIATETPDAFDLQGRRVTNPASGIYIVNGRKVIL